MTFFDDAPPPGPDFEQYPNYKQPEWSGAPENELPAAVATPLLSARTDRGAVLLDGVRVFSTGWMLTLTMIQREIDPMGMGMPFMGFHPHPGMPVDEGRMRFGLEFADGVKVTDQNGMPQGPGDPSGPTMMPCGGGGGMHRFTSELWCWPLPPDGPIRAVVAWPSVGLDETVFELDGVAIRRAAGEVTELWPDERPEPPDDWGAQHGIGVPVG